MSGDVFGLAWMAWLFYWLISAVRVKATERRESFRSRAMYLVPTFIGASMLMGFQRPSWLALQAIPPGAARYWIGVVLLFAGLGFACWARVLIGTNWSANVTLKSGHELIREGPYRWVRHPIYTGLITALLGTAIAEGAVRSLVGAGLIAAGFIYKLGVEERMLSERFKEEYDRYRKDVAALIPGVF
jgi:protein-S-isoprenylcysteine O-methyltransferase Ste14